MTSSKSSSVLVEPHQKHVTGQSDLETALHTLLDHLREPFLALKGDAEDFRHVFNSSLHLGTHKPKNRNGGYARVFAPKIDLRETANAYLIDIEVPGVHSVSSLTIMWRSERELLVEGVVERPDIVDLFGQSHNREAHPPRNDDNSNCNDLESSVLQGSTANSSHIPAPACVVADEANGFEKNEDLHPSYIQHSQARSQANRFVSSTEEKDSDHFPLNIVDGQQLDEGDGHRLQVPTHHHANEEVGSNVMIGERNVGRFMRCFVFPHRVDTQGLQSEMANGLLRIGVPKATAWDRGQDRRVGR